MKIIFLLLIINISILFSKELCEEGWKYHVESSGGIYTCMDEKLRHIPNPTTMNNLFKSWHINVHLKDDSHLNLFNVERPLATDAILVQAVGTPVFFIDRDSSNKLIKRPFPSAESFNRYDFNWNKIHIVAGWTIENIPNVNQFPGKKVGKNFLKNDINYTVTDNEINNFLNNKYISYALLISVIGCFIGIFITLFIKCCFTFIYNKKKEKINKYKMVNDLTTSSEDDI